MTTSDPSWPRWARIVSRPLAGRFATPGAVQLRVRPRQAAASMTAFGPRLTSAFWMVVDDHATTESPTT